MFFLFHSSEVNHSSSREPQEHDLESLQQHHPEIRFKKLTVGDGPLLVRRWVQRQEEAVSLEPRPTETVETFSRFVHLSVLWLVIKTAVLVLCMWKNERLFKGTKWLPDAFF